MQKFKGDALENKIIEIIDPALVLISMDKSEFFQEAYDCQVLGDVLFDLNAAPLANAIIKRVFRQSFNEIFQNFESAGTFPTYIAVFKKVFGDTVSVEFEVPSPGVLNIDIEAEDLELYNIVAKFVENNQFIFHNIVSQDGLYNIVGSKVKGLTTEYELVQMLYELVPAGIKANITLTVLGA